MHKNNIILNFVIWGEKGGEAIGPSMYFNSITSIKSTKSTISLRKLNDLSLDTYHLFIINGLDTINY